MRSAPAQNRGSTEDGFILIEILVSALVLAIAAVGVFMLLNSTTRSAAQERYRTQAYAVAQEDQSRLRSMRLSELNGLEQTQQVVVNGSSYSVASKASFVNSTTSTASCSTGSTSADYVKVFSTVRWEDMGGSSPVSIGSIVSPANGSLNPTRGNLSVSVANAAGAPIPGIRIELSGPVTLTATTDPTGCALFIDQPEGTYTVAATGIAAGLVDKDGKMPAPFKVGLVGGATTPLPLLYDLPGSIKEVVFRTKNAQGRTIASSADSIVVSNSLMTGPKSFGTPGGTRALAIPASSLFPFGTADTVYAGSCSANNPNPSGETNPPGAAAIGKALVPPGTALVEPVVLQLPALYLTVKSGSSFVSGAKVTVSDNVCTVGGNPVKREYATTPTGSLASPLDPRKEAEDPGLPWGTYDVCALATLSGVKRRMAASKVAVQNLGTGTSLTLDLTGPGSESGSSKTCP